MYSEIFIGFFFLLVLSDSNEATKLTKQTYLAVMFLFLFIDKNYFRLSNNIIGVFLPFVYISILCVFFSTEFQSSLEKTISYTLILYVIPTYAINIYEEQKELFLYNIIAFVSTLLVLGIIMYYVNPAFVTSVGRYKGLLFRNPNGMGVFTVIFFFFVLFANDIHPTLFSSKQRYYLYAVGFFTLILASSRNSLTAVAILFLFKGLYRISYFVGFLMLVFIAVIFPYFLDLLQDLAFSFNLQEYFRLETLETASGRYFAWQFAWENIKLSPWLGNGFGYVDVLFNNNFNYLNKSGHFGNVHNSYLTFWLEVGLLGLLAFIIPLLLLFLRGSKKYGVSMPMFYALLFSINFESWLTGSLNPYTTPLLAIIAILNYSLIEKEEDTVLVH
ncbi:MAG: O-antigen ligase family protein [Bacteroidetes bacterium]|nr:O-antigen ligase family protein [Bacteroidota bacterium]